MANSIYNEIRENLLIKTDMINSMLQNNVLNNSETSLLSSKLDKISSIKKELDENYKTLRDYQIKCISMMLCCSLIKRFYLKVSKSIFIIEKYNRFYNTLKPIYAMIEELTDLYVNSDIMSGTFYDNRKKTLIDTLSESAKIFKNIILDIEDSDKNVEEELTVLGTICEYSNSISSDNFFNTDQYVLNMFKNKTFDNIINRIKTCNISDNYEYKKLNANNKNYAMICDELNTKLNYIRDRVIPLFNEENYPKDYVSDINNKFSEAMSYFSHVLDGIQYNNDLSNDDNYKKFISILNDFMFMIDREFVTARDNLQKISRFIDKYEMYFDDNTSEYFNKAVNIFFTMDSAAHSAYQNIRNNSGDSSKYNINDFKLSNIPLNFGNNISTIIDSTDFEAPVVQGIDKLWWLRYLNNGVIAPSEKQAKDLEKEADALINDLNITDDPTMSPPKEKTDATSNPDSPGIPNSLKAASKSYVQNLQYADFVTYSIAMLCIEFENQFPDDYRPLKEFFIKKLSLTGFINNETIDNNGRESWTFMDRFGILPYTENINAGIIIPTHMEFSFFNDISMMPFLQSKDLSNKKNDIESYTKAVINSLFFTKNKGLLLAITKKILKQTSDINTIASLFTEVCSENNFRSKILSIVIYDFAYNMYRDTDIFKNNFSEISTSIDFISKFLECIKNFDNICDDTLCKILQINITTDGGDK